MAKNTAKPANGRQADQLVKSEKNKSAEQTGSKGTKSPGAVSASEANAVKASKANNSSANSSSSTKSIIIAALVILLLLAGIGLLVFGLAQSLNNSGRQGQTSSDSTTASSDKKDDASNQANSQGEGKTGSQDSKSNSANNGAKNQVNQNTANNTKPGNVSGKTTQYRSTNSRLSKSKGNDYVYGDIKGSRYVSKKGDTLWQIAEGRYGSGYAWVAINKANGGFRNLPNGKPVSLPIGYNLILPDLK